MPNESICWEAVASRNTQADGAFVYAVRSTGIYCRPSCPSRRPSRDQVVFFSAPDAAEEAGYRACKRCQPQAATTDQVEWVQRACRLIEDRLDSSPTLAELGDQLNVSPHHLQKVFKRVMGISPREYAEACRVERLKAGLRDGANVTHAMLNAGYNSSSRLYDGAPIGMTPTAYRSGGQGMNIQYTITDSALGYLLVAATEKGVCAVSLGDSPEKLETDLLKEYPGAALHRDEAGLGEWVSAILSYLEGHQPNLALPIDVQATAFQRRVWQELQTIPYGSTRSYGEIAQGIGSPTASRAVARACATNPVALVIPCHRVVQANGDPGGYRWGVERKRELLAREKQAANA